MKKRILALILCVLMVLPVFAGCAKTEAEKPKNADEEISETSICLGQYSPHEGRGSVAVRKPALIKMHELSVIPAISAVFTSGPAKIHIMSFRSFSGFGSQLLNSFGRFILFHLYSLLAALIIRKFRKISGRK